MTTDESPIPFLDLARQTRRNEALIRRAIDRVLARGWYVLGEEGKTFEAAFARYIGVEHATGVGSGTDALHLALVAAGVHPGGEVILPANTCVPTAAAAVQAGAKPVLADILPESMLIDPASIEAQITARTQAIVPVHLYGHPCRMDAILDIAARHGVAVVEDCAQAHGARYKGRACGSFGKVNAFSFYPTKNLGALGDGGAAVTNDPALAARLRMLRNYGESKRYWHEEKGVNSRLDEIQAAILLEKLPSLDSWNRARQSGQEIYAEHLADLPLTLPAAQPDCLPCWHLYPVRTSARDRLQAHLRERGIGTLIHYPVPIHLQPAYADLGYPRGAFPAAEHACAEVLSLPLYPELKKEDYLRVAREVRSFFI